MESKSGLFQFKEPRQQRIYRRLMLVGEGAAAFFLDACNIVEKRDEFRSASHLVSHCIREIEASLRQVLETVAESDTKAEDSNEGHSDGIRRILNALDIDEADPIGKSWLVLAPRKLHGRAHRNALASPRPLDDAFLSFWDDMLSIFDTVLERFESRYLDVHSIAERLAEKDSPSSDDIDQLRNHLPNNFVTLGKFFEKLQSSNWLKPLAEAGFFSHPPLPHYDGEGGAQFPWWPASQYLARMAKVAGAQEIVHEIAIAVPPTENVRVHEDLADAVLPLPAELAAQFVPLAKDWLESPYLALLPGKLAELVSYLAREGKVDEALELAGALFAVLPDPKVSLQSEKQEIVLPPEPRARFELWNYQEAITKCLDDLVDAANVRAIELLCDLLVLAERSSHRENPEQPVQVFPAFWRSAIEDHEQNSPLPSIKDYLVVAIRDSTLRIASSDESIVPSLVATLEKYGAQGCRIFDRIALYLLSQLFTPDVEIAESRLTDRQRFDDAWIHREYWLLAAAQFSRLSENGREQILSWIENGPDKEDVEYYKRRCRENDGNDVEPEQVEQYINWWRTKRLSMLKEVLPPLWKTRYETLTAQLGEPDHPEFISYTTGSWNGPTSPKSSDELEALELNELIEYLNDWQPSNEWMSDSREGLGRELQKLVSAAPSKFASDADRFKNLDPAYVRSLISGLREAVKQKRQFPWGLVLDLCQWIVQQPREIPGRTATDPSEDPDWGWTRKAIADLLMVGFDEGSTEIPIECRSTVWPILHTLAGDTNPTPEHEARYGGSNMDPATLSINTTRGSAFHAIIQYALWVRRHSDPQPNAAKPFIHSFNDMPEVREVLDYHLDPNLDPSVAVRSVYGRWFPWLGLLDRQWSADNLERIFPRDSSQAQLRDAAWNSYILFCRPFDDTVELIRDEYIQTIECLGEQDSERILPFQQRLAEHVATLYWRGSILLEDENGILERFFLMAPDKLRGHIIKFIGSSLDHAEGKVNEEILARLKNLWEKRLAAANEAGDDHYHELIAFGWWFASGKFDDAWALGQLEEVLRLVNWAEPDRSVVENLVNTSRTEPLRGIQCLSSLFTGDRKGWALHGWRQHAETILSNALVCDDPLARTAAKELINRFAARGHFGFAKLLDEN